MQRAVAAAQAAFPAWSAMAAGDRGRLLLRLADLIEANAAELARLEPGFLNCVLREPLGVVGQIVPWNFPLMFTSWKMGPALQPATRSCTSPPS